MDGRAGQILLKRTFSPDKVGQVVWYISGEITKVVHQANGVVEVTSWAASGALKPFKGSRRWRKMDSAMLTIFLSFKNALSMERSNFGNGNPARCFSILASGVAFRLKLVGTAVKVVEVARSVSGEINQVLRSVDGAIQSVTTWAGGAVNGFAAAAQRVTQKIRTAAGELMSWVYHPGGALKEFSKWAKSTVPTSAPRRLIQSR